jgi:general secretion pathway protein L
MFFAVRVALSDSPAARTPPVSENTSILCFKDHGSEDDTLLWWRAGEDAPRDVGDAAVAEQLQQGLAERAHRVVFAAPGSELRLQELGVTREEKRHLEASLPFMLEESLAEDIDHLHFARVPLDDTRVGVAVVRHDRMAAWQARLAAWSAVTTWYPLPLLLPWQEGQWSLARIGERVALRSGRCEGGEVEVALLPTLLASLAAGAQPEVIVLYGEDEAADRALLPDTLRDRVQWRRGGFGAALLLTEADEVRPALRQGAYAPRLPYERWWAQWRAVAALLLVAVLVQLFAGWLDLRRLERDNLALRGEIQSLYREVNPRGAVVDAEKQLRRQLAALGGGSAGLGFTTILDPLGQLLAREDGASLASLNFSRASGQLRINMLAADFAAVERVRAGLVSAGLEATLESSARAGDRVRARLRIEGGAS